MYLAVRIAMYLVRFECKQTLTANEVAGKAAITGEALLLPVPQGETNV
jgi:hypothetical protein